MVELSLSRLLRISVLSVALLAIVAPAGAQFTSLGVPANETLVGEPSCVSWPQTDTSLQCYVRGASGTLWQVRSPDSVVFPSGWKPLGGALTSDPVCVSPSSHEVACFATFVDGALWRTTSLDAGETFTGWWLARGNFVGKPSCVVVRPSVIDCFSIMADGNVHTVGTDGGHFVVGSKIGSGPFSLSVSGSMSILGPICVSTPPPPGRPKSARCFAQRPDGSFWTVDLGPINPPNHGKVWTDIPILRRKLASLDCFSWPSGRIDCFGSNGTNVVHHFANVPVPPPPGRTRASQSGGFFHTEQPAPTHVFPVRCLRSAASAAIDCVVVAWRDETSQTGPRQLQRLRFNEEPRREPENLGGDLRSAPSCVLVAARPDPTTLTIVDAACFALGSNGDLVYRRLDPPADGTIAPINPPEYLVPATPIRPFPR